MPERRGRLFDVAVCRGVLPVHATVHAELGDTCEVPDPSAPGAGPSHLLFVCDRGGRELLVAGVAEPWEVLSSLGCHEDGTTVWVLAETARSLAHPTGLSMRRVWTAEVTLERVLGGRQVRCCGAAGRPTCEQEVGSGTDPHAQRW